MATRGTMPLLTPERIAELHVAAKQDAQQATGRDRSLLLALASLLEALGATLTAMPPTPAPAPRPAVPETIACPHCGALAKLAPYAGPTYRMCQRGHHFKDENLLPK